MSQEAEAQVVSSDLSFEELEAGYHLNFGQMRMSGLCQREAEAQLRHLNIYRPRYTVVETMAKVPWYWVGITHLREGAGNFHSWLHNGDPMFNHEGKPCCTVDVPRGRPHNPDVSWEQGALDALTEVGFASQDWDWTPERCAWAWEKFNGFGYREYHHIPSPYLWGMTSIQEPGKYVRDREFDPNKMDEQLGTMAVLKLVLEEGAKV